MANGFLASRRLAEVGALALVALFLLCLLPLCRADYYVIEAGDDNNDGQTISTAWATLDHAQLVLSGDPLPGTLWIGNGYFDLKAPFAISLNISGISSTNSTITLTDSGSFQWTAINATFPGSIKVSGVSFWSNASTPVISVSDVDITLTDVSVTISSFTSDVIELVNIPGMAALYDCSISGSFDATAPAGTNYITANSSSLAIVGLYASNIYGVTGSVVQGIGVAYNLTVAASTFSGVIGSGCTGVSWNNYNYVNLYDNVLYNLTSTYYSAAFLGTGQAVVTLTNNSLTLVTSSYDVIGIGAPISALLVDTTMNMVTASAGTLITVVSSSSSIEIVGLTISYSSASAQVISLAYASVIVVENLAMAYTSSSGDNALTIEFAPVVALDSIFFSNVNLLSGPQANFFFIAAASSAYLTNSVFYGSVASYSLGFFDQIADVLVQNVTYQGCGSLLFGLAMASISNTATVTDSSFLACQTYTYAPFHVEGIANLTISGSQWLGNYGATGCGIELISANATIIDSVISGGQSQTTSAVLISTDFGSSGEVTFINTVVSSNTLLQPSFYPDFVWESVGSGIATSGTDVTIVGGYFDSVFLQIGNLDIYPDPATAEAPAIYELVTYHGFVSLYTDLVLLGPWYFGVAYFPDAPTVLLPAAYVYGHGHTLTTQSGTYMYSAFFYDTNIIANGSALFCCVSGDVPPDQLNIMALNFFNSNYTVPYGSRTLVGNRFQPVSFDQSSSMIVQSGGLLTTYAPASALTLILPNLTVEAGGEFAAVNLNFSGNATISQGALLTLFPNKDPDEFVSPLILNGFITMNGNISLSDLAEQYPFPLVSLEDSPALVVQVQSGSFIASPTSSVISPGDTAYQWLQVSSAYYAKPVGLIAQFTLDSTLSAVIASFMEDVNVTVPADCSGLIPMESAFDPATLRCVQQSSRTIWISSTSLPEIGDVIPVSGSPFSSSTFNVLQAPPQPWMFPVAYIAPIPASHTCGGLVLDGSLSTGLGSYPASFSWTLSSTTDTSSNATSITSFLASISASVEVVEVPSYLLSTNQQYTFTLVVTNVLGMTSSASPPLSVTTNSNFYLPPLTIDGDAQRSQYVGESVVLSAFVNVSMCQWSPSLVKLRWFADDGYGNDSPLSLPTSNSSHLFVPASYFSIGQTYTFRVYATADSAPGLSTAAEVTIFAVNRPMTLIGSGRTSFVAEDVQLAVSAISYSGLPVSYSWSLVNCPSNYPGNQFLAAFPFATAEPFNCLNSTGGAFVFPFTSNTTVSTSLSWGSVEPGNYTVSCTAFTLTESSTVNISFALIDPPTASSPPQVEILLPDPTRIASFRKIAVSATVNGDPAEDLVGEFIFSWSVAFGVLNLSGIDTHGPSLIIPHSSLQSNQQVGLTLSVSSVAKPNLIGHASTPLPVVESPYGGLLVVSPIDNMAATFFTLSAQQWSSHFHPLRYQFAVSTSGSMVPLCEWSSSSTLTNVTLNPASSATNVSLVLSIMDALGSITTFTQAVTIPSQSSSLNSSPSSLLQSLQLLVNASNWRLAYNTLLTIQESDLSSLTPSDETSLWSVIASLSSQVALSDDNIAVVLQQLEYLSTSVPITAAGTTDVLLGLLDSLVQSPAATYGTSSVFSEQSTSSFVNFMSNLLATGNTTNTTIDPTALVLSHGNLALNSLSIGEPDLLTTASVLEVSVGLVNSSLSTATAHTSSSIVSTSFVPSSATLDEPVIGYSYALYDNSTYPYSSTGNPRSLMIPQVAQLTLFSNLTADSNSTSSPRSLLASARVVFSNMPTTVTSAQPACATWDSTTQSWQTESCSTTTGQADVTCDCPASSGMTVLFGDHIGGPPHGLAAGSIAAIVVVCAVVVMVAVATPIIYFKNPMRASTKRMTRVRESQVEMTMRASTK